MSDLCIVEGKTEEHLIKSLREAKIIWTGRIEVINLFQRKLGNKILSKKWGRVHCVIDTDVTTSQHLNIFNDNLDKISAKEVQVLMQNKNFEDALCHCTSLDNIQKLYRFFDAAGEGEFKANFLKTRNVLDRLQQKGFDHKLMYSNNNSHYEEMRKKIITNSKIKIKDHFNS